MRLIKRPEWDSNPRIADLQSAPFCHKTRQNQGNLNTAAGSAELALKNEPDSAFADEGLRQVIDRWASLNPAIKAGILALVQAQTEESSSGSD